jgi:HSP20 family protein
MISKSQGETIMLERAPSASQSQDRSASRNGVASSSRNADFSGGSAVSGSSNQPQHGSGTAGLPPVDIYEDESGITVFADLPGVSRENLGIRVTGDNLVIEGVASVPAGADMELLHGELHNPQYRRSFTLSRELDPQKIEAELSNGVLHLHIPKAEEARPRRIEVNVG